MHGPREPLKADILGIETKISQPPPKKELGAMSERTAFWHDP